MRKWGVSVMLPVFVSAVLVSTTFAGPWKGWRGSGGWGKGGSYQQTYNPATIETLSGEVVGIEEFTPMKGMQGGIHLLLKTDTETVSVHLGPAWYIEKLDSQIEPGDTVDVRGSRITFQGNPAVIAAELKKGDAVLPLRDERGIPVWSGWRRGR